MSANISTKFAGLQLKSPVIVSSSGLTGTTKHLKEFEDKGAGAIVLKSIFEEEILFEYDKFAQEAEKYGYDYEYLDYFDYKIKQDNLHKYVELIKAAKETVSIPVIASVNCVSPHEWTFFTKKIEEAGADALELNIFLLPSDPNKTSNEIEETYVKIVEEVRKATKLPLIIKMSHYFTNLGEMIKKVDKAGADAIVLFNRHYNPDIDINARKLTPGFVFSSPNEITLPLRWIGLSYGKVDASLAASTGVHSGEGLVKVLLAGASAVEIASAIYKNGANIITQMNGFLAKYLEDNNFASVDDIKGLVSQKNVKNPAAFERVQFMRYFSDNEADIV